MIYGVKGHSLVFTTGDTIPPEALFLEFEEAGGAVQSPEFFPRPDGTIYVCAISSDSPLPIDPAAVVPVARQACFRPIAHDGLPLNGRVPGVEGAYIATGHSVWGILNAPATGEAMAELIVDGGARSVDLTPFDPARLPPLDPARLRRATGE